MSMRLTPSLPRRVYKRHMSTGTPRPYDPDMQHGFLIGAVPSRPVTVGIYHRELVGLFMYIN